MFCTDAPVSADDALSFELSEISFASPPPTTKYTPPELPVAIVIRPSDASQDAPPPDASGVVGVRLPPHPETTSAKAIAPIAYLRSITNPPTGHQVDRDGHHEEPCPDGDRQRLQVEQEQRRRHAQNPFRPARGTEQPTAGQDGKSGSPQSGRAERPHRVEQRPAQQQPGTVVGQHERQRHQE